MKFCLFNDEDSNTIAIDPEDVSAVGVVDNGGCPIKQLTRVTMRNGMVHDVEQDILDVISELENAKPDAMPPRITVLPASINEYGYEDCVNELAVIGELAALGASESLNPSVGSWIVNSVVRMQAYITKMQRAAA